MPARQYQIDAARDMATFVREHPGGKAVWSSPTGSGKSLLLLLTQAMLRAEYKLEPSQCPIIIPTPEIVKGFLEKAGATREEIASWSDKKFQQIAYLKYGLCTPKVLRNRLLKGDQPEWVAPRIGIFDECHHAESETYKLLELLSPTGSTWIGVTATPFRGSVESTVKFRATWGPPRVVLTLKQAIEHDPPVVAMPTFRTIGLLDDEEIAFRAGEFVDAEVEAALTQTDRLNKLAALILSYATDTSQPGPARFDRPTMVAMPTVAAAQMLATRLGDAGMALTGETHDRDRANLFALCEARKIALVTVAVVGEGVDLPWLRRLVDARPTASPVAYQQLVGRVMRPVGPGEAPPEVVSVCRNILRHGYLFDGLLPRSTFKQAKEEFPGKALRHTGRWLGLESMGRLKKHEIPLADGNLGCYYSLESLEGHRKVEWVVFTAPHLQDPLVCVREIGVAEGVEGLREYNYSTAKWAVGKLPDVWDGFSTGLKNQGASEKQVKLWKQTARLRGFDPEHKPTRRDMQVFFAVAQTVGRV